MIEPRLMEIGGLFDRSFLLRLVQRLPQGAEDPQTLNRSSLLTNEIVSLMQDILVFREEIR
jgi:hypothetical protein